MNVSRRGRFEVSPNPTLDAMDMENGALTRPTFGQVWSTAMLVLQNMCFDILLGLA